MPGDRRRVTTLLTIALCVSMVLVTLAVLVPAMHLSSLTPAALSAEVQSAEPRHAKTLTLKSPNPHLGGDFGWSVATSGKYVVVGAPGENDSGKTKGGNAYVYDAKTGALDRTLTDPNVQANGHFGYSVSIYGQTVVVGAPYETSGGYAEAGNVYVYDAATGTLLESLISPNAQSYGEFGTSVANTGSTVVIGAPDENSSGDYEAGNAYLFGATDRTLISTLTDPFAASHGYFGGSVAINGSHLLVGAAGEGSGYAFFYDTNGTYFRSYASLELGDVFGAAVALTSSRVAIGAPGAPDGATDSAGATYVYDESTGAASYTLVSQNPQEDGDFGCAVAIDTKSIVVGAYGEAVSDESQAGHLYEFKAASGDHVSTRSSPNAQSDGFYGWSVSLSTTDVVVGAPYETASGDGNAGHVYLYVTS
jgi:hypothetical protein